MSTVAGSPARARKVPGGVNRRREGTNKTAPATSSSGEYTGSASVSPARSNPAPTATRMAARRAMGVASAEGAPGTAFSDGTVTTHEMATSGSRPRKTQRQPKWLATWAASAGPTSPGTTHAVDRMANMRGCRRCG